MLDRALPFLGPGLALLLGLVGLGHRSLDVDEAAAVAAARGSFSDVVERALSHDPAQAGYLALLQPVVDWNDAERWSGSRRSRPPSWPRSPRIGSVGGSPGGTRVRRRR